VRYAYPITAALLFAGTAGSLALQAPGNAQDAARPVTATAITPPRAGAPMSFADLAAQLQPAVVNISTTQKVQVGTLFDPFSGNRQAVTEEQQGGGSGFLISADGYIVTNDHVISGGPRGQAVDTVTVTFPDKKEYVAKIIGRDATSDIAVLKIEAGRPLPFVEIGSTSNLRVGDWVVAIGNPLGLGSTVTAGIVSALQRNTGQGGAYDRFIQTDTAINRGNSGGPLFDLQGRVVGINNRLISPVGANIGINFAIPADAARPVIESLRTGAAPKRGYLGISIAPVDEDVASALGLAKNQGEIVQSVVAGQAADKAGLKAGDIVTRINGEEVTPDQTLSFIVANTKPGQRIPVEIVRQGKRQTLNAVVGTRPSEEQLAQANFNPDEQRDIGSDDDSAKAKGDAELRKTLGLAAIPLTSDIARQLGVDPNTKGVVVDAVAPGSDAAKRGLRRGIVILSANYKPTATVDALSAQIAAAKKEGRPAVLLEVRSRGASSTFIPVRLAG
jgi:serine protease Do